MYVCREIEAFISPCKCGTLRRNFFLTENYFIIKEKTFMLLNKHTELISKCRHRNKFTLGKVNY